MNQILKICTKAQSQTFNRVYKEAQMIGAVLK